MINAITEDRTQSSLEKCVWIITALESKQFASTLTSMIGKASKLEDGNIWWRQALMSQHYLKNWKVMLWVVASLLSLVEDVFSGGDKKAMDSDLQHVFSQPSWSPVKKWKQDSRIHTPWTVEKWSVMKEEEIQKRRLRSPPDPSSRRTSRRNRQKTKSSNDCHLERKEIRVRDLGLGYKSDEIVLFKYCVGTCHSSRKNYDLALNALIDNRSISNKKVSSHPCCRPTSYETVSFMDTQTTWQTIKWLSASHCKCVG